MGGSGILEGTPGLSCRVKVGGGGEGGGGEGGGGGGKGGGGVTTTSGTIWGVCLHALGDVTAAVASLRHGLGFRV